MKLLQLLVASSFLMSSCTQAFATNCFDDPRIFPTHTLPGPIVVGDLNGDGGADFIAPFQGLCESGPGIMVFLGNGDGSFQSQLVTSSHADPWSLTLADLNGDGRLDILAAYGGCGGAASALDVLIGNGDGTFQAPLSYQAGGQPDATVAGDFNNDGILDVLVSDGDGGQYLLLGNGDGTLRHAIRVPEIDGISSSWSIAAADFNQDGNLDFVFAAYSREIAVELGNGDGTFGRHFVLPVQDASSQLAVGDLNGDGKPDVVVTNNDTDIILLGNGDGTLRRKASYFSKGDWAPVVADLNGDGIPDLVVTNHTNPPDIHVLFGRGDGTFPRQSLTPAGINNYSVGIADFNQDGRPDILAFGSNQLGLGTLLLNNGTCH